MKFLFSALHALSRVIFLSGYFSFFYEKKRVSETENISKNQAFLVGFIGLEIKLIVSLPRESN